ncbi:DUF2470 domain-containing protein [Fodinicola acaciae]|uniref:DUF2470 domain-containing protein n=1 Tax=Fodinicola acaciae TaxID=2681555 RepID=UPI0013D462CA|nr:DUF2470 domain-containing protein [Fodinicola acaciae]
MEAVTGPSAAERARTLAAGVVNGVLFLPRVDDGASGEAARRRHTTTFRVQHLTDPAGQMLLLVEDGTALHSELENQLRVPAMADVPGVLDVLDVPPGQLCLPRARLCVVGWTEPLGIQQQRALADSAACARPVGALLDVGRGWTIYRFDVAEIRITTAAGTELVSAADFAGAAADPLYEGEDEIVEHLETYHRDRLIAYAIRELPTTAARDLHEVSIAGLDRYGLDLLCGVGAGHHRLRAGFHGAVTDPDGLARQLCLLLGCPCGTAAPLEHHRRSL